MTLERSLLMSSYYNYNYNYDLEVQNFVDDLRAVELEEAVKQGAEFVKHLEAIHAKQYEEAEISRFLIFTDQQELEDFEDGLEPCAYP